MAYIVSAVAAILGFLVKKFSYKLLTLPIKIAIYSFVVMAISAYVGAYVFLFSFIFSLVNKFYSYIENFNNFDVSSGSAYGISLSSIWHMFIGFLSASGIGSAFYVAVNLFLSLLFGYMIVKITIQSATVFKNVANLIANTSAMVG